MVQRNLTTISINTNPYQGLKLPFVTGKSRSGKISINTNPYQGLKLLLEPFILRDTRFQLIQIPIRD